MNPRRLQSAMILSIDFGLSDMAGTLPGFRCQIDHRNSSDPRKDLTEQAEHLLKKADWLRLALSQPRANVPPASPCSIAEPCRPRLWFPASPRPWWWGP